MYLQSSSTDKVAVPGIFRLKARAEIRQRLLATPPALPLRHGSSPLKRTVTVNSDASSVASLDAVLETSSRQLSLLKKFSFRREEPKGVMAEAVAPAPAEAMALAPSLMDVSLYAPAPSLLDVSLFAPSASTQSDSLFSRGTSATGATAPSHATNAAAPHDRPYIMLEHVVPLQFHDMYPPEILANPRLMLANGRPAFTVRDLVDWELNDVRSLLILEQIPAEWLATLWPDRLPVAVARTDKAAPRFFAIAYLPVTAPDETYVATLVASEIYAEARFSAAFREQAARYTVGGARHKAGARPFTKPEWRNIIENFTLNLAIEYQCRGEYKRACREILRQRGHRSNSRSTARTALLHTAIRNGSSAPSPPPQLRLSPEDKAGAWRSVQSAVYRRLGLDWRPDEVASDSGDIRV